MKKAMTRPARADVQGSADRRRRRCARRSRCRSSAPSPAAWSPRAASRGRATPRRACCATTSWSTKARSGRCAASRTTCREVKAGLRVRHRLREVQRHQGRRRHRGVRHGARRDAGLGRGPSLHGRATSIEPRCIHVLAPERVGDQIRDEISGRCCAREVHDPGIGFLTVTRVKVTADLQQARVSTTRRWATRRRAGRPRGRSNARRRSCAASSASGCA